MTWEEFWWPLLLRSIVSMLITAVFGTIIGFLVRHWLKTHADYILRLLGVNLKAARSGAADAAATKELTERINTRMAALEEAGAAAARRDEAYRAAIDADLGRRARQELRFTQLEKRIDE